MANIMICHSHQLARQNFSFESSPIRTGYLQVEEKKGFLKSLELYGGFITPEKKRQRD